MKIVDQPEIIPHYRDGKKVLHRAEKKGETFDVCATLNEKYICCNFHVLKSVSNCPFDCSYCFLQDYLNNGTMQVTQDTAALIEEVKTKTATQPWRFFRIGTWELGDSLALENAAPHAAELVKSFAEMKNAILELRTKSDQVDNLLGLKHNQHTVVAWTLNPQSIIRREEHRTASLEKRLSAMKRVFEDGYLIGLHFDPMIYCENWQTEYEDLIKQVFQTVSPDRVTWISIGSFRLNPEMKKTIEHNFPGSQITAPEMILGDDHKLRYAKPLRVEMYSHLVQSIRNFGGTEPFIYLCMERWNVWKKVLGYTPESIGHLDYLMINDLYNRYPNLVHVKPDRLKYDEKFSTSTSQ